MALMGKVRPIGECFLLILLRGEGPPRLARYTKDGYFIQGIIGVTKIDGGDLWADISDLIP